MNKAAIRQVVTDAVFTRFRRAAETPFNPVHEVRPFVQAAGPAGYPPARTGCRSPTRLTRWRAGRNWHYAAPVCAAGSLATRGRKVPMTRFAWESSPS